MADENDVIGSASEFVRGGFSKVGTLPKTVLLDGPQCSALPTTFNVAIIADDMNESSYYHCLRLTLKSNIVIFIQFIIS